MTLFKSAAGQFEVFKCLRKDAVKSSWIKAMIETVHVVLRHLKKKNTNENTQTALRTEDTWHIFCFSCPFISFEARRKSQHAKLVQTTSIPCR